MKKKYSCILNYGAGVGSTALVIALLKGYIPDIQLKKTLVVFSDTGAERPWTYEYLEYFKNFCKKNGISLEIVRQKYTLEEYVYHSGILPSRRIRWCTPRLKMQPIRKRAMLDDISKPYLQLIGFDVNELSRIPKNLLYSDCIEKYPLIELKWDRLRAIKEIKKMGLKVPKKSACFCCPFQRLSTFVTLMREYPDLKKRVIKLEDFSIQKSNGKRPFYLFKEPIRDLINRTDSVIERAKKRKTYLDDFGIIS